MAKAKVDGRDRSFCIQSSCDVFDKLCFELGQLRENISDVRHQCYVAVNAATTAWHCLDWFAQEIAVGLGWDEVSNAIGEDLRPDAKTAGIEKLQMYAIRTCVEMRICQQVATAAKHMMVSQKIDKERVATKNMLSTRAMVIEDELLLSVDDRESVVIEVDGDVVSTYQMADRAADWLQTFARTTGLDKVPLMSGD